MLRGFNILNFDVYLGLCNATLMYVAAGTMMACPWFIVMGLDITVVVRLSVYPVLFNSVVCDMRLYIFV